MIAIRRWLRVVLFAVLLATTAPVGAQDNPCQDPLYLELKGKKIDELSQREFDIFKAKDTACTQQQRSSRTEEAQTGMQAAVTAAQWIYVLIGGLLLLVLLGA
ncbi:MAG: hypothetical protein HY423_04730 [Candidatus Lambdaproteobacteria bacterium]|nr:hypothetical protein [Candidatus Lambdaproteobacteria bacterium]